MSEIDHRDGLSRRKVLECMTWCGTGVLWTIAGGVPHSLGIMGEAQAAESRGPPNQFGHAAYERRIGQNHGLFPLFSQNSCVKAPSRHCFGGYSGAAPARDRRALDFALSHCLDLSLSKKHANAPARERSFRPTAAIAWRRNNLGDRRATGRRRRLSRPHADPCAVSPPSLRRPSARLRRGALLRCASAPLFRSSWRTPCANAKQINLIARAQILMCS